MSAKNSQGRLIYWACRVDNSTTPPMYDYLQFAVLPTRAHVFRVPIGSINEADANRLVGCWNALADLSQDAIEGGWTRAGLEEYGRRMKAHRDELLAALKAYDAWTDKTFCTDPELKAIRNQIRAAIAKATVETP